MDARLCQKPPPLSERLCSVRRGNLSVVLVKKFYLIYSVTIVPNCLLCGVHPYLASFPLNCGKYRHKLTNQECSPILSWKIILFSPVTILFHIDRYHTKNGIFCHEKIFIRVVNFLTPELFFTL